MSYTPSFAIINSEELQRLSRERASASVMSVYLALCAYAQQDDHCFPSLGTIKKFISGSITISTISKAIRWLREKKFIVQNNRASKKRFQLTYREIVKSASNLVKRAREKAKEYVQSDNRAECVHLDNRPKNQRRKPPLRKRGRFFRKKKAMGYGRFGSNGSDNREFSDAEKVFGAFVLSTHYPDISGLSVSDKAVIMQSLQSNAKVDIEWREWVEEVHPGCLPQFLLPQGAS